jgi:hypothetical protein
MGTVYLSFTPGGRPIALKVVRPEYATDEEFRRRFRQEITAAQRVQGIYTAPVIDADADADTPWLATAYVPGPSLQQAVAEHGPLPLRTVFRLVGGIAEALISIHAAGLVHRDLKPANVLLAEDGPRVIDFGIAHAADATTLTRTGVRMGTPAFMSPEQVRGKSATAATDVFALGQLAVFAATGHPAFGEGQVDALLYRIANAEPDLDDCPPILRDLVARCLSKEPAERSSPTEIVELAREQIGGAVMEFAGSWLPDVVAAALVGYNTSAVRLPPPTPAPAPAPAPPTPVFPSVPVWSPTPGMDPRYGGWQVGAPMGQVSPFPPTAVLKQPGRGLSTPAVIAVVATVSVAILAGTIVGAAMLRSGQPLGTLAGTTTGAQPTTGAAASPTSRGPTSTPAPRLPQQVVPGGHTVTQTVPAPRPATGYQTYQESGFSISVPNGWTRRTSDTSVFWDAPDGVAYLQVDVRSWAGTPRQQVVQADRHAQISPHTFPGYSLIGISDVSYADGATDWEFTFTDPKGNGLIHAKDRFFTSGGGTYSIYLRGPGGGWATLQSYLTGFLESFQVT